MMKLVAASESETKGDTIATIMAAVKIQKSKIASGVVQLLGEWDLAPFEILTDPETESEQTNGDKVSEPDGGESESRDTKKWSLLKPWVWRRRRRQLFCLAEILYISAQFTNHPNATSVRNLKPTRTKGPDADTDVTGGSPFVDTMQPAVEEKSEEGADVDDPSSEEKDPRLSYFAHLSCAVIMYSQGAFLRLVYMLS